MAKVIRDASDGWKHTFTCSDCRSKVEIAAEDVFYDDFGKTYIGEHDFRYYALCPVCHKMRHLMVGRHITRLIAARTLERARLKAGAAIAARRP